MAAGDIQVQHGSITFGASEDTATDTITAVASTSSAFVLCLGVINTSTGVAGSTNHPNDLSCQLELTNTTTVTATRLSTGINSDVTVYYAVIEYVGAASGPNEFVVHRFSAPMSGQSYLTGSDFGNYTSDEANTATWLVRDGFTHTSTGTEGNSMTVRLMGDLTGYGSTSRSASPSRAGSSIAGTIQFEGQIVEFLGSNWVLLHGFGDAGTESSPAEIFLEDEFGVYASASFDWTKAFMFATKQLARVPDGTGGYNDDHDDSNDMGLVAYPGDGDGDGDGDVSCFVAAQNNTYDEARHDVGVVVIYNTDATFMSVEHIRSIASGGESSLSASTSDDYSITDVGDLANAFAIGHAYTDSASHDLSRAAYQAHLTGTANLRFERATATGTGEFSAQIVTFEAAPSAIELPHLTLEAAVAAPSLSGPLVLPHLTLEAVVHPPSLPTSVAHRDTVYYATSPIQTDLSQFDTDITSTTGGAYESSSARAHITGERNVYYNGDLGTGDSEDVLAWHGSTAAVLTNTWALVVKTGGTAVAGYHGSTEVVSAELPNAGAPAREYKIGWSTRANPDTTGPTDAQISELWVQDVTSGQVRIVQSAPHAAASGLDTYTFAVGGWWDGATLQASPANAPAAVRVGTTYYSHVQYADDFVASEAFSSSYKSQRVAFPVTRASGLGSDGQWYGPEAQFVAHMLERSGQRLASPLVNEVYRDSEVIYRTDSGLYTMGTNSARAIYAPDGSGYQLCSTFLRWARVPLSYSKVRVRVNLSSYPTSGDDVPLGIACYSMERPPPWPTAWRRATSKATLTHTSRNDREWIDLGELELVRLLAPGDGALDQTTHLCLGVNIDPDGESTNDNALRVYIHAWHVIPAGDPSSDYDGPEVPPFQQLQPLPPEGGLSPNQLLSGGS